MKSIRIVIAGSRTFTDYPLLARKMDAFTRNLDPDEIEVVSGEAKGADQCGERWAIERAIPIKRFPAEWDRYGRSAGYKRNDQMRDYATHLVAFHQDNSRGTQHMINSAYAAGLLVRVVKVGSMHRSIHDEVMWI